MQSLPTQTKTATDIGLTEPYWHHPHISQLMNSKDFAKYIEETDGIGKSWLLVQLRLQKLAEAKPDLSPEEYIVRLEDIHRDMMNLGKWWLGIEHEVF
jgi:hypothetical protein